MARLGDAFGLANIGVNLTRPDPGAESALLYRHTATDEFTRKGSNAILTILV